MRYASENPLFPTPLRTPARDENVHAFGLSIFSDHESLGPPACRKMLMSRIEAVGSEIALHGLKAVSGDSLA
ncbi:hypothetical protein SAMN06295912_15116, partial [Sphingomonas laterariae]